MVNRAIQVNDASSLAQIGQYTIQFQPQYQRVAVHRLEILRGGGSAAERTERHRYPSNARPGSRAASGSGAVTAVMLIPDARRRHPAHRSQRDRRQPGVRRPVRRLASWDQTERTEHRRVVRSRRPAARSFGACTATTAPRVRPDETRRRPARPDLRGARARRPDPESQIPADTFRPASSSSPSTNPGPTWFAGRPGSEGQPAAGGARPVIASPAPAARPGPPCCGGAALGRRRCATSASRSARFSHRPHPPARGGAAPLRRPQATRPFC